MFGGFSSEERTQGGGRSLARIAILSDLPRKELALLASECEWRDMAREEIVISTSSGGTLDGVVFVVSGAVRLAQPNGLTGQVDYMDVGAGGQFGEMAVFGIPDTELTVIAKESGVLAILPQSRFAELLTREESVSRALLVQYAHRLRSVRDAGQEEAAPSRELSGEQRVYGELISLAEPRVGREDEAGGLFVARLPRHRELANRLSTTEEVVARAIAELVRSGVAVREYPGLLIRDEQALRHLYETRSHG